MGWGGVGGDGSRKFPSLGGIKFRKPARINMKKTGQGTAEPKLQTSVRMLQQPGKLCSLGSRG